MRQDNPMLPQLKHEYETNAHFAALADSVAQDVLDCSFGEAMNAYPDAKNQSMQLMGSGMRLVCNAIFKMYAGLPPKTLFDFNEAHFARAQRECRDFISQVQGFQYVRPEGVCHVVRDVQMPAGSQEIACFVEDKAIGEESEAAYQAEYHRCHTLMMRAIQEHQIRMVWAHYLHGTMSGFFENTEEQA